MSHLIESENAAAAAHRWFQGQGEDAPLMTDPLHYRLSPALSMSLFSVSVDKQGPILAVLDRGDLTWVETLPWDRILVNDHGVFRLICKATNLPRGQTLPAFALQFKSGLGVARFFKKAETARFGRWRMHSGDKPVIHNILTRLPVQGVTA